MIQIGKYKLDYNKEKTGIRMDFDDGFVLYETAYLEGILDRLVNGVSLIVDGEDYEKEQKIL